MAAPYTGPGISIHVTFYIHPAQLPAFFEALKPCYNAVTAEPECEFFEIYQSPSEPGVLRFVETWNASLEWLAEVQMKKAYYEPYRTNTEPMWAKPRTYEIFERMAGKEWVSVKDVYWK